VANSGGASISVIDVAGRKAIGEIPTGKAPVRVGVAPDGTVIYGLQAGTAVGFANPRTMKEEAQVALPGPSVSLDIAPDGKVFYSSVQEQDKIVVFSTADRKIVRTLQLAPKTGPDPVLTLP
jgi:YVTN family beta-propeller protein